MRFFIPAFAALVLLTAPLAASAQTNSLTQQDNTAPAVPAKPGAKQTRLAKRFAGANVTHDGHLTLEQAKSAKWKMVVKNFAAIDSNNKGYVTEQDIRAASAKARAAKQAPASKT